MNSIEAEPFRELVARWRERMNRLRNSLHLHANVEHIAASMAYGDAHGECAEQLEALLPPQFAVGVDPWRMLAGADEAQQEKP